MSSVYWRSTESEVRRAMSLQDFNAASTTYGCCDRAFWHYRTISSFPAGTMQQLALPFAVLFDTCFPGNEWHQDPQMLDRARAAMAFWARMQHPSGSVDEWYRNEHSYCATAFTTFGVAEAYRRLREQMPPDERNQIARALTRAVAWLSDRFNDEVMNQNLAACAALWTVHQLDGEVAAGEAYRRTWHRTLKHQHEEGWFAEYGGADPGYSLLALDLLALLDRRGCQEALQPASRLSRFLASLVVGGSDLAGCLGSRGTEHSFPFGAEIFAESLPQAAAVAAHLRAGLERNEVTDPRTVDDRYLAYFYLPSFVLASSLATPSLVSDIAVESTSWEGSGFRVWRWSGGDVVCSTRRRGAFNLYAPSLPVHRNLGYWIETEDGRRFATCAWSRDVEVAQGIDSLIVEGVCVRVDDTLPLVRHEMAFRAATHWLFAWPAVAGLFHRFIKKRKMIRQISGLAAFRREMTWRDARLVVRDVFDLRPPGGQVRAVTPVADIDVHSPSARLGGASRIDTITIPRTTAEAWAARLNQGRLALVSVYDLDAGGHLRFAGIREESDSANQAARIETS
jgi:hypothetical protein